LNFVVQSGAKPASSVKYAAGGVDFVITMLPVGADVRKVFLDDGIIAAADRGTVLIDCSTLDVDTAHAERCVRADGAAARNAYACPITLVRILLAASGRRARSAACREEEFGQ